MLLISNPYVDNYLDLDNNVLCNNYTLIFLKKRLFELYEIAYVKTTSIDVYLWCFVIL